jgi:hypothetical protein
MIGYVDSPTAWPLTRGMARLAGVDLPRAVLDGWLSRSELASIVGQCQEGGCKDACLGWLGKGAGPAQPPAFCAIRAEIAALAPEDTAQ